MGQLQRMSAFFISELENLWANKEGMKLQREQRGVCGRGVGGGKGEEVGRSKPERMLSCTGMLLEFEFLVVHNNIHIVLFFS